MFCEFNPVYSLYVKLWVNIYLHDILDQWGPARELVGLLAHTLLTVELFAPAESGLQNTDNVKCSMSDMNCPLTHKEMYFIIELMKNRKWTAYICDDWDAQVSHIGDDLTVLRRDLGMLDQLVEVLLCDSWFSTNKPHYKMADQAET